MRRGPNNGPPRRRFETLADFEDAVESLQFPSGSYEIPERFRKARESRPDDDEMMPKLSRPAADHEAEPVSKRTCFDELAAEATLRRTDALSKVFDGTHVLESR